MNGMVALCVNLKARIEVKEESSGKVYLHQVQMYGDPFRYVLESQGAASMIGRKETILALFLSLIFSFLPSFVTGVEGAATERWMAIAGKEGEERILYDQDSVIPSRPRVFRVWIMGFDKDHFPRKSLEEFDCANRIVREIEVIADRPNKPAVHSFTPSDWSGVVRESPRGELLKILCR